MTPFAKTALLLMSLLTTIASATALDPVGQRSLALAAKRAAILIYRLSRESVGQ